MEYGHNICGAQIYEKLYWCCIDLGKGDITVFILKAEDQHQEFCSAETELVGVDNAMSFIMWMNLFISEQGAIFPETSVIKFIGNDTVIQQDNTSSSKLEINGRQFSIKHQIFYH